MAEEDSPRDEGPPEPGEKPRKEGNPWERQRAFNAQRRAVLRPRGERRPPDDPGAGGEPSDAPDEFRERMAEYRRRQRIPPRPGRAPEAEPAPAEDDDERT